MASSENKDLQYDIRFIKPALRRHYVQLTEHLKAAEVLPEFFANGIITLETKQELDCVLEKSGSIKFSRAVVDKLLETSYSPEDLKKVLDILESKQETLYGSILKWISDLEASGNVDDLITQHQCPGIGKESENGLQTKITDLQGQVVAKEFEISGLKQDLEQKNNEIYTLKLRVAKLEMQEQASKHAKDSPNTVPKMVNARSADSYDLMKALEGQMKCLWSMRQSKKSQSKGKTKLSIDDLKWDFTMVEYAAPQTQALKTVFKRYCYSNRSDAHCKNNLKGQSIEMPQKLHIAFEPSVVIDRAFPLNLPAELVDQSMFPSTVNICPDQDISIEVKDTFTVGDMTVDVGSGKVVQVQVIGTQICYEISLQMKIICSGSVQMQVLSPEGKVISELESHVTHLLKNSPIQPKHMAVTSKGVEFHIRGRLKASFYTDLQTNIENVPS